MDFDSTQPSKHGHREAVLVHLDATDLPDEFWKLNERLYEELERSGVGEFDGNEIGQGEATLFAYGPDANRLFSVMRPILRSCAVCRNARAILRQGGPGAPQTELVL